MLLGAVVRQPPEALRRALQQLGRDHPDSAQMLRGGARPRMSSYRVHLVAAATMLGVLAGGMVAGWSSYWGAKDALVERDLQLHRFRALSVLVELDTARAELSGFSPAWPEHVAGMKTWLDQRATSLRQQAGIVSNLLQQVRASALPLTEQQQQADHVGHPRYPDLVGRRSKVAVLEQMLERSRARSRPEEVEIPANYPDSAAELNALAWQWIGPYRDSNQYGQEALGLALARRAVTREGAARKRCGYRNTLAWALFANGSFDEAVATSKAALGEAPRDLRPTFQRYLATLQAAVEAAPKTLATARQELAALEREVQERRTFEFENDADRYLNRQLQRADQELRCFLSPGGAVATLRQKLTWAERIQELTLNHPGARVSWQDARKAILAADGVVASSLYREHPIDLVPQVGLVPIGMNPRTGLWEFYHLRSAFHPSRHTDPARIPIPVHDADGAIEVTAKTGIIFVLLPGGTFLMGSQHRDPRGPNFDRQADNNETLRRTDVEPFLVSKYEMTQAQWRRLASGAGGNPSRFRAPDDNYLGGPIRWDHPVESVSWTLGRRVLGQFRLTFPTEAQWEYACRSGATTSWFTGKYATQLRNHANLSERAGERWLTDGHQVHAPVGSFRPNRFGLHDTHGNVFEWCLDRLSLTSEARVLRGGSWAHPPSAARSACRFSSDPDTAAAHIGIRPARALRTLPAPAADPGATQSAPSGPAPSKPDGN